MPAEITPCLTHIATLHAYEVELEKVRGEMKALSARVTVFEGFINSTSTRFHVRLDGIETDLKADQKQQIDDDLALQKEIETLKLHFKYLSGIAVGIGFLLTYFDKIAKLFK